MSTIDQIGYTLICAVISGLLYTMGGGNLIKLPHNKLYRRLGCPIVGIIAVWLWLGFDIAFWWAYLLTIGVSFGAMSSYHDYLGSDNFWVTGFVYGLAALPLIWAGVNWYSILIRAIVLCALTGIWSYKLSGRKVVKEELGRGILYILTILLLII